MDELLRRAQAQGVVRHDVEPAVVLQLLLALAHASEESSSRSANLRGALDVVIDGLRARAGS